MLEFREIKTINDEYFNRALQIYRDSFPENQRLSLDRVTQRTQENSSQKIIGGFINAQLVLMALLHSLQDSDFILLAYLATDNNYRGQGIGTGFFDYLLDWVNHQHQYLILEVEDPDFAPTQDDREYRLNRIKFYRKRGAIELKNVHYLLPPLSGNIPTEMKLLIMPKYPDNYLDGNLVKKLVKQIYQEVYCRHEDDQFLNSFIHQIEDIVYFA